jgi:hypothetical protein
MSITIEMWFLLSVFVVLLTAGVCVEVFKKRTEEDRHVDREMDRWLAARQHDPDEDQGDIWYAIMDETERLQQDFRTVSRCSRSTACSSAGATTERGIGAV